MEEGVSSDGFSQKDDLAALSKFPPGTVRSKTIVRISLLEERFRLFPPGANGMGGMLRTADAFSFPEHFRNDPHPFLNGGIFFVINAGKTAVAAV